MGRALARRGTGRSSPGLGPGLGAGALFDRVGNTKHRPDIARSAANEDVRIAGMSNKYTVSGWW